MSQVNTPKFDKKLDRILAASAAIFARDGYEKATIRNIASELELSYAGLYHYVKGKEELLFLIQYRTFSSLLDNLRARTSASKDPKEKLRYMIENHIEHYVAHMDELIVCTHELQTLQGDFYDRVFELRKDYFSDTLGFIKQIGSKTVDPHIATLYLFGMLNWIYMWHNPKINKSAANLAKQMIELFFNGYLSKK